MDTIRELFEIQRIGDQRFNINLERMASDPKYRLEFVKEHVLGMYEQVTNLMATFNWKRHTFDQVTYDRNNTLEQLVDITKYVTSMINHLGFTVEEFTQLFEEKTQALNRRWDAMEINMKEGVDVVLWDIDGCIANYSDAYEEFLASKGLVHTGDRSSYSFAATFGITKPQEEAFHSEFIQSGHFRNLGVYREAVEIMQRMKNLLGVKIVLITARPAWQYKRLVHDTYGWLDENKVPFDFLLWDKDKADAVLNYILPANVLGFIEDRDKHALELSHLGIPVYLIDKTYNRSLQDVDNVTRVDNYDHIYQLISDNKLENEA